MRIFRKGRHRAPKGCRAHAAALARLRNDLEWSEADRDAIMQELADLRVVCRDMGNRLTRSQVELRSEEITIPIPVASLHPVMIERTFKTVPATRAINGHDRAPSWAARS